MINQGQSQRLDLQLKNEFSNPIDLKSIDRMVLKLQRDDGLVLEKEKYEVDSFDEAKVHFALSDFEVESLKLGKQQTFIVELYCGTEKHVVHFSDSLDVYLHDDKKMIK